MEFEYDELLRAAISAECYNHDHPTTSVEHQRARDSLSALRLMTLIRMGSDTEPVMPMSTLASAPVTPMSTLALAPSDAISAEAPSASRYWHDDTFNPSSCLPALYQLIDNRPSVRSDIILIDKPFLDAMIRQLGCPLQHHPFCRYLCDMQGHWDQPAFVHLCLGEINRAELKSFCLGHPSSRVRPH